MSGKSVLELLQAHGGDEPQGGWQYHINEYHKGSPQHRASGRGVDEHLAPMLDEVREMRADTMEIPVVNDEPLEGQE